MTSKMKTKQMRWLAATLMLVAAMVMPSKAWAETITPSLPSGEGTTDNPYKISTAAELYWFAALVKGDTNVSGVTAENKSACAELTANISVSGTWTPIMDFKGTFDGQGHTISGLQKTIDSGGGDVGLFHSIVSNAEIRNVGIVNCIFKVATGGSVGGVCGRNEGGTITNCYNTGSVTGNNGLVGGICGINDGTITNCYNTGLVNNGQGSGGICGNNNGTITNCYYLSGTATGGINGADAAGSADSKSLTQFASGEVAYLLNEGKAFGTQVWGQQLGVNDYPVLGSPYKLITTAYKKEDGTYWATFSDLTTDVTLSVPSTRTLKVYNATVSAGTMTLTGRSDNQVAMGEGVLLKTDGKYVNVKANDEQYGVPTWDYYDNNLVATPETAGPVGGDVNYKLYRLTYNTTQNKDNLGFYLGVATVNNTTYYDGFYVNATPGKAYLKVQASEAKVEPFGASIRGFAFPGDDGETTGIECITVTDEGLHSNGNAEGIFDLQGRKVSKPTKGVYIKNNRVVFKLKN